MASLGDWFIERPRWISEAAKLLCESEQLSEEQIEDLFQTCLQEARDVHAVPFIDLSAIAFGPKGGVKLGLKTIEDVVGINQLCPKGPLRFGPANLTIIYGDNGSGKSGYVKILKRVCGIRDPGPLLPNVFKKAPQVQRCRLSFELNGVAKTIEWTPADGPAEDLRGVDIFDAHLGRIVLTQEKEVTYEPPILTFLSDLVGVCDAVAKRIKAKLLDEMAPKVELPREFLSTPLGTWFGSLGAETTEAEISEQCKWSETDETLLRELDDRLSEASSSARAIGLRRRIKNLEDLIRDVQAARASLSDDECQVLVDMQETVTRKREVARVAAKQAFSGAPLEGVGSELWRALWAHARKYSEKLAYPEEAYPFTEEGSRCVLCQQELEEQARIRLVSFEEFVKGAAENDAEMAERKLTEKLNSLTAPPAMESMEIRFDACGIEEAGERDRITSYFRAVGQRHAWLLGGTEGKCPDLPDLHAWEDTGKLRVQELVRQAEGFEADANSDRADIRSKRQQLASHKWATEKQKAIGAEVERFKRISLLEKAKSLTSTTALSIKKSELADALVSEALIQGFERELKALAANRIQVELVKTRTEKGHTLHRIQLKGLSRTDIADILSEGELRIVSLAAMLADATVGDSMGPFVFDDPISSLDQRFEEAVAERLVNLALDRQVVVFTHRLSLLGLLDDAAGRAGLNTEVVCVRQEPWGTGEPGTTPLAAKNPSAALRNLKNERLAKARKALSTEGSEAYYPLGKAICSDFRILLERTIESILLADVVQRHRRQIQTLGKLKKIALVEATDCNLLDDLMTKYSRFEHSQSLEAPMSVPEPEELEEDIDRLLDWIESFRSR